MQCANATSSKSIALRSSTVFLVTHGHVRMAALAQLVGVTLKPQNETLMLKNRGRSDHGVDQNLATELDAEWSTM